MPKLRPILLEKKTKKCYRMKKNALYKYFIEKIIIDIILKKLQKKIIYNDKKHFIIIIRNILIQKMLACYNKKYNELLSFALMFEKKYKKFLIFRPCKFSPDI